MTKPSEGSITLARRDGVKQTGEGHETLLSIIIPAYNEEMALQQAVNSCLFQMGHGMEVIIVDDCSSDSTGAIADRLAGANPDRIRVVHNRTNLQLLESRKIGFESSRGEYVMFLDADDELSSGCCCKALALAEESEADIVAFPALPCYEDGNKPDKRIFEERKHWLDVPNTYLAGEDIVHASYRDAANKDSILWSLWGKLYRRSVLEQAFKRANVHEMFYSEDAYFYFIVSSLAQTLVSSIKVPPYRYHMGCGDTFAGQQLDSKHFGRICKNAEAAKRVHDYLKHTGCLDDFTEDYKTLRFRLLQDPVNRFPKEVPQEHRAAAFDELLAHWPAAEAIGVMAAVHWHEPEIIASAVLGSASLTPHRLRTRSLETRPSNMHLALCIDSITAPSLEEYGLLDGAIDQWRAAGFKLTLIVDNDLTLANEAELTNLEDVNLVRLPKGLDSYGTAYLSRAIALRQALIGSDAFLCCERSHVVAWDLMIARSVGACCTIYACGTLAAICTNGGFPAELPLLAGLANTAICANTTEAAFWKPFVGSTLVMPTSNDTVISPSAFWLDILSRTSSAPAMTEEQLTMWRALLGSTDALRGKYFEHLNLLRKVTEEKSRIIKVAGLI